MEQRVVLGLLLLLWMRFGYTVQANAPLPRPLVFRCWCSPTYSFCRCWSNANTPEESGEENNHVRLSERPQREQDEGGDLRVDGRTPVHRFQGDRRADSTCHGCVCASCPSEENPCENGGQAGPSGCRCRPGFSGPFCELQMDKCASNPCRNGFCYGGVDGFSCLCEPGYAGRLCELGVDDCPGNGCRNNSTFIGRDPGLAACFSDSCRNGGRCVAGRRGYWCLCPSGFTGADCSTKIDNCVSNPCVHGRCLDGIHAYHCECRSGWGGSRCETDIDECESQPCVNHALCVDGEDQYLCLCSEGYSGTQCEQDLDVCHSTLCLNGGTCVDGPGLSYTCRCMVGFTGDHCETVGTSSEPRLHFLGHAHACSCQPGLRGRLLQLNYSGFTYVATETNLSSAVRWAESGRAFFHMFLCGAHSHVPTALRVRYRRPAALCMIEIVTADRDQANHRQKAITPHVVAPHVPQVVPGWLSFQGLVGCILELRIDSTVGGAGRKVVQGGRGQLSSPCERNPCAGGATCIPRRPAEWECLCPYGRQGLLCEEVINVTRPRFSGLEEFGYTSYAMYAPLPSMGSFFQFQLKLVFPNPVPGTITLEEDRLILFSGQKGRGSSGDFFVLGVRNRRVVYRYDLGSGVASVLSDRLNPALQIHSVSFGRHLRNGWLKVDGQRNRTVRSPGRLDSLSDATRLYVGGLDDFAPELVPAAARFKNTFQGCIFDVQFRTRPGGRFHGLGEPESGRGVGQCSISLCAQLRCRNGGSCVDSGSSARCRCRPGWKGALCSERVSFCHSEHDPPPACAHGSTCFPLPDGYVCRCPLGAGGRFCQQALPISDALFNASRSSWMAFPPLRMRHRTHLRLHLRPLVSEGIVFYVAQYPSGAAGDFISVSLAGGFVQLHYNLGDTTVLLQSPNRVDPAGGTWHTVTAGREGNRGYLILDGHGVSWNASTGASRLDVTTKIFVGGVPDFGSIRPIARERGVAGFTGGIREIVVNGHNLELTERGALAGANVADWDGTACGYRVCKNGGTCQPLNVRAFTCVCARGWTGRQCESSVYCERALCQHGSKCVPVVRAAAAYSCMCALGWQGEHCDKRVTITAARFVGNSYIRARDPKYAQRNLSGSEISFKLWAGSGEGLVLWMGEARTEDNDYLAVGLRDGRLEVAVNLGEEVALPIALKTPGLLSCTHWRNITVARRRTVIRATVDGNEVAYRDVDPFERYVALDYRGTIYLGGFEPGRDIAAVSAGLFNLGFTGRIKDLIVDQDTDMTQLLHNAQGLNVFQDES